MNFLGSNKMMLCLGTGKDIYYKHSDIYCDVNHDAISGAITVTVSLSFHNVCNVNQELIICLPRINSLLTDIDESYITLWVYHDQYEDIFSKLLIYYSHKLSHIKYISICCSMYYH